MVKKKILLYQGGRYFSTEKTYKYFKNILNDYTIDMYENVEVFSNKDFFNYSTTVFFSQEGNFTEEQEKNLLLFVSSGRGFIGLHGSTASFKSHPKYYEMLGGRFLKHKNLKDFDIEIVDDNHPITKDLKNFSFKDEPYRHDFPIGIGGDIHILAEAHYHDKENNRPEPIIWVKKFGEGRVFYCALGHRTISLKNDIFQAIIKKAVRWVLNC